jgi:predicted transcriptional regulator
MAAFYCPPIKGGNTMPPLPDVSDRANKVYDVMKAAGLTAEDKMRDADQITHMSKLPKNMVLNALQELMAKGYAKRRAREKAAGYYLIK